ncbi:ComEC family competence protein [Salmonella enterica subsp. enterica]|uniref:ComEC family competence protein n=1 Tax=Salmonella enterica I TaxID=59201 RepID=A0A379WXH3_SALET|nr:ComEC family competence protein [Salmonella enterica subsp. enterica]
MLFCLACLLASYPSLCALRGINLALFHVGDICRQAGHLGGKRPAAATQEATVVITATDHMATHYGRITICAESRSFLL